MTRRIAILAALGAAAGWAQGLPNTGKLPVVFVNGYQNFCPADFESTFGAADQILQSSGIPTAFFNNCDYASVLSLGKPSLEELGQHFGEFIRALKYADGTPVGQVDVVAHSMGGLIVRAYLSGITDNTGSGAFAPPPAPQIRKIVFLGTPHWGTPVAQLQAAGVSNPQTDELSPGSNFLWAVNTWNDNTDDLRGIDAIAVAGTGGTDALTMNGVGPHDGVVPATSAALGFYMRGRTRLIPYCHVEGGGLVSTFGLCASSAPGIARMRDANHPSLRIILSFLNGTADWQSIGQAAEADPVLSANAAVYVRAFDANNAPAKMQIGATLKNASTTKALGQQNEEIGYTFLFPAGSATVTATTSAGALTSEIVIPPASGLPAPRSEAFPIKPGPNIARAIPAAGEVLPLSVAPRMIVAIYGERLAAAVAQAQTLPLTTTLSDAQATLNGTALPLYYASPGQVNTVLPADASGLAKLAVQNAAGLGAVNVLFETAHPVVFTANASGAGLASAINVRTGTPVTAANALHPGETVSLYLTGLGKTTRRADGLDWADATPAVTVGGVACTVTFAGAQPTFAGLDQINCDLPTTIAPNPSAAVVVTSSGRSSNAATLPVR